MELICPKCQCRILSDQVNISEGVAYCGICQEYFKIAEHLRDDEELRRISKPYYSKVRIDRVKDHYLVTIPPGGWSRRAVFLLLFVLFWNGTCWLPIVFGENSGENFSLLLIPFLIGGVAAIVVLLFFVKGVVYINFNRQTVEVVRQLFGFRYRKIRQTNNLKKITESVAYTENYQPVYGIGLLFKKEKKVVFGSELKEEERKWLIGELYEMKSYYQLAPNI